MSTELDTAFFGEDGNVVSFFVTKISLQDVQLLLKEQYEDDDAPISKFAEDIGLRYFDHDALEVAKGSPTLFEHENVRQLYNPEVNSLCSYYKFFAEELLNDVERMKISATAAIFIYGYDYKIHSHYGKKSKHVYFVNSYKYKLE